MTLRPGSRRVALSAMLLLSVVVAGCATSPTSPPATPPPAPSPPPAAPPASPPAVAPPPAPAPPSAAPLPATAHGVAVNQTKGYFVEQVRDGLYWVTDGAYQAMFLTTGQGVIVVDAPPNLGPHLLAAIHEVTSEPVTHVIYSHAHADHIASAGMFPANATYIAHAATAEVLARDAAHGPGTGQREFPFGTFVGGGPVPMPTVTFVDNYTLSVGNQTLELRYLGPAHEPGNIFIYAPKQQVLMLVDVIFPGWAPFFDLALAKDVPAFVRAHDQALAFNFTTFIGGHLGRLGTRADVETQRAYVLDVQANAAKALQTVDFMAIAQQTGFENAWLLFGTYLDAVAAKCADLTLKTWQGRLGGADIVTEGHCHAMMESLRID